VDANAPSTAFPERQTVAFAAAQKFHFRGRLEHWLEAERGQLPLWLPVVLSAGIASWFALPLRSDWIAFVLLCLGGGAAAIAVWRKGGRAGFVAATVLLTLAAGCLLAWTKAVLIGSPVLTRPAMVQFEGKVERVEPQPARAMSRLILAPLDRPDLPRRVRLNVPDDAWPSPAGIRPDDVIRVRSYLMPPARPALPGGYDYAQRAWFDGIGATGKVIGMPEILRAGPRGDPGLRERLIEHVATRVEGAPGALAVTLVTGDQGRITQADQDALRQSGLAHLLSISGVHVTALIGFAVFVAFRLLALSRRLALRWPLMLIAAAAGAAVGIGYTLLTGAQVPTIRSCITALLVMAGLALGREALSLRLLAVAALAVVAVWPETVIGPSFQMSFTAVCVIISLHEHPAMRRWLAPREEGWGRRAGRYVISLAVTGLAVEAALIPIALFHFHKTGLLGVLANMIAIPLTEFVVLPAQALALVLDLAGVGAPMWWIAGKALGLILSLAHAIAAKGAATLLVPAVAPAAFVAVLAGLYWLMLWRTTIRWLGLGPLLVGLSGYALSPHPDILVTGDGRHVAIRMPDGRLALLRDRAGDYVKDSFAEMAGVAEGEIALSSLPGVRCSEEFCAVRLDRGGRVHDVLVARSRLTVPWQELVAACASADIVIADRRLPRACTPRWLKLDRADLGLSGGAAIELVPRRVHRSLTAGDDHPWAIRPQKRWPPPQQPAQL